MNVLSRRNFKLHCGCALACAVLLTACGATGQASSPSVSASATASPSELASIAQYDGERMNQSFTYMKDAKDALHAASGYYCRTWQPRPLTMGMRAWEGCQGLQMLLYNYDLDNPEYAMVKKALALFGPFVFVGHNWVVVFDSADDAQGFQETTGYEPLPPQ